MTFPYNVIGVMATKKQDSSYDGWDVNKIFIPFAAMRRDFPDKPPGTPTTFDQLLVTPKSVEQHEACKARSPDACSGACTTMIPTTKKPVPSGTRCRKPRLSADDRWHEIFSGRGRHRDAVSRRPRRDERDDGGGAGDGRARSACAKRWALPRARILKQFFIEALMIALVSGGIGLAIAYGICCLVNLLPMPDFFAGLLPTWQSGLIALPAAGHHCGFLGAVSGAPSGVDRSDRSVAVRGRRM